MPGRRTQEAVAEAAPLEAARGRDGHPRRGRRLAGPARRRDPARRACCRCWSCTLLGGGPVVRQPAHGARRGGHGGAADGQPEHDVPAAARAGARGPRRRGVGAPGAPLAALLPPHGRRGRRARPPGRGGRRRAWTPWPPPSARCARSWGCRSAARGPRPRRRSTSRPWPARPRSSGTTPPAGRPSWTASSTSPRSQGDWPRAARAWSGTPTRGGRGRVVERVVAYEPRSGQERRGRGREAARDPAGRPSRRTSDGGRGHARAALRAKQERGVVAVVDFLFVRRPQRESLQRTLRRVRDRAAATSCAPPPALRARGGRARGAGRRARPSRRARSPRAP